MVTVVSPQIIHDQPSQPLLMCVCVCTRECVCQGKGQMSTWPSADDMFLSALCPGCGSKSCRGCAEGRCYWPSAWCLCGDNWPARLHTGATLVGGHCLALSTLPLRERSSKNILLIQLRKELEDSERPCVSFHPFIVYFYHHLTMLLPHKHLRGIKKKPRLWRIGKRLDFYLEEGNTISRLTCSVVKLLVKLLQFGWIFSETLRKFCSLKLTPDSR